MPTRKTSPDLNRLDRVVAEARRNQEERERGYREQALKLFPWICGRCAREFDLKNLRELTVHHKNHNHDDDRNCSPSLNAHHASDPFGRFYYCCCSRPQAGQVFAIWCIRAPQ